MLTCTAKREHCLASQQSPKESKSYILYISEQCHKRKRSVHNRGAPGYLQRKQHYRFNYYSKYTWAKAYNYVHINTKVM